MRINQHNLWQASANNPFTSVPLERHIHTDVAIIGGGYGGLSAALEVDDWFNLSDIDSFGYVSIFSHYGGLLVYSSLRKANSLTLEHSF
jgi:hypothetical protein